jgi:predicted enzyme related to lactoylglutathione lyase
MIKKVKLVTITVRDQQRALTFYRDKIGLKVLADERQSDGSRWIELVTSDGGSAIALVAAGKDDKIGCFSNVIFGCDNVYNTYHDLRSRGVEFVTAPAEEAWGTFAVFKDPDGNSFVIAS